MRKLRHYHELLIHREHYVQLLRSGQIKTQAYSLIHLHINKLTNGPQRSQGRSMESRRRGLPRQEHWDFHHQSCPILWQSRQNDQCLLVTSLVCCRTQLPHFTQEHHLLDLSEETEHCPILSESHGINGVWWTCSRSFPRFLPQAQWRQRRLLQR